MAETYQKLTKFKKMKLEKNDRIISNADYEKLVGLAELHERVIYGIFREIIEEESNLIHSKIDSTRDEISVMRYHFNLLNSRANAELVYQKNCKIKQLEAEIARLQKRWWKSFKK